MIGCAFVSDVDEKDKSFTCTSVIGAKRVIKREFTKHPRTPINILMPGHSKEWKKVCEWIPTICRDTVKEWRA